MAVSGKSGHRQRTTTWMRLIGQLSRYDLVLAAIPLIFGLALVVSVLPAVPLNPAIGGAALISGLLVTDALYLHPPTRGSDD